MGDLIRPLNRPGDLGWVIQRHGEIYAAEFGWDTGASWGSGWYGGVDFARDAGYTKLTLWTNDPLMAARRIYLAEGFELVGSQEHDSFGHHLIGQVYELPLVAATV